MKALAFFPDQNSNAYVRNTSDFVDARVLAANVAESLTKPVGVSKILFSTNFAAGDTITFGGLTVTAVASGAGTDEFVPGVSLSASITALVTQLNAAVARVGTAGTFTATDGNTSITFTNTVKGTAVNAQAKKTSGGTNTSTVTNGARFVRLSGTTAFYYNVNGTAVAPAADVTNGTSSVYVTATDAPLVYLEDSQASISIVAAGAAVVTAEWYN